MNGGQTMNRHGFKTVLALIGASGFLLGAIGTAEARTLYSDDGISELNVPDHWEASPHLSLSAVLRAIDPQKGAALVVNTYLPDEINTIALAKQAENLSRALLSGLENGQLSAPRLLTIQGRPAIEYEVTGLQGSKPLHYLSTLVEGQTAKHHLIVWPWSAEDAATRETQRALVASFRESTKQRQVRERIDLAFNWPRKADATFDFKSKKTRRGKTSEVHMSGVTRVRALDDKQLLISTQISNFDMRTGDKDAAKRASLQHVLQQASSGVPDYVVSTAGAFIGIENINNYRERLENTLLKTLPEKADAMKQTLQQMLHSAVSEKALTQALQDEWNNQVGNWAGGSYAVRESYVYAAQYQSAALGETVFPMVITQRLLGRVPCNELDKGKRCVMLEQVSRVNDPAFSQAMHAFVTKTVKGLAGDKANEVNLAVDKTEFVNIVTLVTHPEALLPYLTTTSKVTTVVIRDQGRTETNRDVEESSTRYTY